VEEEALDIHSDEHIVENIFWNPTVPPCHPLKGSRAPPLSHPVSKTNQVLPICMPGSSSIHIVTSLVNNRNNIT
jgi:hypothetical protein